MTTQEKITQAHDALKLAEKRMENGEATLDEVFAAEETLRKAMAEEHMHCTCGCKSNAEHRRKRMMTANRVVQ